MKWSHTCCERLPLLLAVVVLGSMLVMVAAPAVATVPGANGTIVYERDASIWAMKSDGSGQVVLLAKRPFISPNYHEPVWSPDGAKIAYRESPQFGIIPFSDDLWVMNADGTGAVNVTNTASPMEANPAWSPDGTKIVYERDGSIWTMNADGSGQVVLVERAPFLSPSLHEPAWSPDGTKIAYRRSPQVGVPPFSDDLWVVSADGTGAVNVTNTASPMEANPAWSPDGTKIAYERDNEIWTMNADGSDQAVLVEKPPLVKSPNHHEPVWSPDGTKVAYRLSPTFGIMPFSDDLWVVNADGSGAASLTATASPMEADPSWQAVNRAPVAANESYATVYRTALSVPVAGVLGNDTDPDGDALTVASPGTVATGHGTVTLAADGSFTYMPALGFVGADSFTYAASDGSLLSNAATVTVTVSPLAAPTVGLQDPATGRWYLRNSAGTVTTFYFGNPGDVAFMGDWDCDGVDTPGLFRQSDAYAYLRNSNTEGVADIRFFFGNPSDVPLAGDFDGDGCDTLSIYRPSEQRFYIMNELGEDEGGLGAAEYDFVFGNPGDKPVVGDWDGDGIDEVGLHRESTGFFYWRTTLDTGITSGEIYFGDPGDRFVAGDWGVVDVAATPAVFRPSNLTFYFRHTLTQGVADAEFVWSGAGTAWMPVAGRFGLG